MSQENVDRLQEATGYFNRLGAMPESPDLEAIQSFFALLSPEIRFEPQQALLQGIYEGHDGVAGWLADLAEHYAGGYMDYIETRDVGDQVLALGTLRVTGKGSGIDIEVPLGIVASFRDGLVCHLKDYGDHAEALEAVGLSE